jgi:hypothetical protein
MPVPRWRVDRYTDDGCSVFQCLNCYKSWEGRCSPGYTHEGIYNASWRFCPICGVEWKGPMRESEDEFGPRRTKIKEAIRRYWDAIPWDQRYPKPPAFWWVIEQEFKSFMFRGATKWEPQQHYRGLVVPAKEVLARARELQRMRQEDFRRDEAEIRMRVVRVRDMNAAYGEHHKSYEGRL